MSAPTVSIPLEEGEVEETHTLQEYANKLAAELHRVKHIIGGVSLEEIGMRIEEIKISIEMYRRLFEILVHEQTNRMNVNIIPTNTIEDQDMDEEDCTDTETSMSDSKRSIE